MLLALAEGASGRASADNGDLTTSALWITTAHRSVSLLGSGIARGLRRTSGIYITQVRGLDLASISLIQAGLRFALASAYLT